MMPALFAYKISRDYGFAPHPFRGLCSLATCKPKIRSGAKVGDLVLGFSGKGLGLYPRLLYAMKVTEKMTFDEYWRDSRFLNRRPRFDSSLSRAFGDNIYHTEDGSWVQEDSHHSRDGGVVNISNLTTDTGSNAVLVSNDFAYWGREAISLPAQIEKVNGEGLFPETRDFRRNYSAELIDAVHAWFAQLEPKGLLGLPRSWQ